MFTAVSNGLMKKQWFCIIVYSFLFFLGGFLSPIGYIVNNSAIFNIGIFSIVSAFFLCMVSSLVNYETQGPISKKLFHILQVKMVQEDARIWLILHGVIQTIERIIIAFFFSSGLISFVIMKPLKPDSIEGIYYFTWFLLLSTLAFPYFHRVRNLLGMGYDEVEGASIYGAQAFAKLASRLLRDRNRRGIRYLSIALRMLEQFIKSRKLSLNNIKEALTILFLIEQVKNNNIEYKELFALSDGLTQQPLLLHAPDILKSFLSDKKFTWTKSYHISGDQRQSLVKLLMIVATLITAIGTAIQAILPESQKILILNLVTQFLSSPDVIILFLILVLMYILTRYTLRIESTAVKWNDINRMKKATETKDNASSTFLF